MGSSDVVLGVHPREAEAFQPRKRFKTSELPLSATQRSTIDDLLHTIKKKGEYDTLRKKVWSQFVESVSIRRRSRIDAYLFGKMSTRNKLITRSRMKRIISPIVLSSSPTLKSTAILRFSRATAEKLRH